MSWSHGLLNRNKLEEIPLAKLTTFRIGGLGQVLTIDDPQDLPEVMACEAKHFLGKGANLLVCDEPLAQPVVRLGKSFARVERLDEGPDAVRLRVGAGHDLALLTGRCCRDGLGGLEGLSGVPATIGGALAMNAGTASHWLFDVIERVQVVLPDAPAPQWFERGECQPVYRSSGFPPGSFFVACELRLMPGVAADLQGHAQQIKAKKAASQPLSAASAGCMFKNPRPDLPAGKLVQELGLKGERIGNAEVSEIHGNFIVNCGGASAADVAALVRLIRGRAAAERGVDLHMEVQLWELNPERFAPDRSA